MARPRKTSPEEAKRLEHESYLPVATAKWGKHGEPLNDQARAVSAKLAQAPVLSLTRPPITSALDEKRISELGTDRYRELLLRLCGARQMCIPDDALAERIQEVYRLCFEPGQQDMSVVVDFAAYHPALALSCRWLAQLARLPGRNRYRLWRALAAGFQRASNSNRRGKGNLRRDDLEAAQFFHKNETRRLKELVHQWDIPGLKAELATDKAEKLVKEEVARMVRGNRRLAAVQEKVIKCLLAERPSGASRVVAAKLFSVRASDIDRRNEVERAASRIRAGRAGHPCEP